jgi:hypothetical protein
LDLHFITTTLEIEDISGALEFWVSNGVLRQFDDIVVCIHSCPSECLKEYLKSGSTRRKVVKNNVLKEHDYLQPMIIGFLTARKASTSGDIHRTLKMFVSQYNLGESELEPVLKSFVERGNLEFDGSNYDIVNRK